MQANEEGQEEWWKERHGSGGWSWCLMAKRRGIDTVLVSNATEKTVDAIIADHAARRQLEERVRELEAALERLRDKAWRYDQLNR